uniref:SCAN box domain-containing protein n=1 Tax=Trichuris muris TaxID=70415 RepID=A0A5S6QL67_TRIMR
MESSARQSPTNGDRVRKPSSLHGFQADAANDALHLNAVRVDLPQFDDDDVETWILMCENLMLEAGVRRQDTIFRKLLAKLPPHCFRAVKQLATQNPLSPDCYEQLTRRLRQRFALTDGERLQKLQRLPSTLGDLKPSQLYGQLEALYPDEVDSPIVKEHFLKRLPQPLRLLCREWLVSSSLANVAVRADQHYTPDCDVFTTRAEAPPSTHDVPTQQDCDDLVAAATRFGQPHVRDSQACMTRPRLPNPRSSANARGRRRGTYFIDRWCRIHQRYGPQARNCMGGGCSFLRDMQGNGQDSQ